MLFYKNNNLPIFIENLEIRDDIPISNKYELIKEYPDDIHCILYYIDEYKFNVILRRLDASCGWGANIKIKIYCENNNNSQIISLGSCEKNYKKMNINCNVKLNKVIYNEQKIPKIIIQTTYNKNINNILHYNSILTYIELNPEYEYKIFDNNDARLFIKSNFDKNILVAYDLIIPGAFKADFFRYCYLYINGGCYFDCKSILRVPLRDIIAENDTLLLCKDIGDGYYNAVMLCLPKNDLLLKTINMSVDNICNFYNKYNLKINLYNKSSTILSFTGPVLIYNAIKNDINNSNIKFSHKYDLSRKHDYEYQKFIVEYNSNIIITKEYKSYNSSSGMHYSEQWIRKEVIYTLCGIIDNYKFYKFIPNIIDKFDFYVFMNNILIIERIDNDTGWGDNLKLKIINEENNKELLLNVGSSNNKEKIVYLDNNFFTNENIIKSYTFYNEDINNNFNISICKNKHNIKKLIILNNQNTGWDENLKLYIELINNKIYNIDIEKSNKNIKIIELK
jgi:mannosyltransferase OCH1-like enzyme